MALGVAREYRNRGIAPLFYYETLKRSKRLYTGGEISWVEETNKEVVQGLALMGARRYKNYRLYERTLSP